MKKLYYLVATGVGFLGILLWLGLTGTQDAEPIPVSLEKAFNLHAISSYEYSPVKTVIKLEPNDPYISIPINLSVTKKKLRISFLTLDNISAIKIYYGLKDHPYSEKHREKLPVFKHQESKFDFPLTDGHYDSVRLDFDVYRKSGIAIIDNIEILPLAPSDRPYFVYVLALVIAISLILPGTLIYSLISKGSPQLNTFQLSFFALSIVFYVLLYPILLLAIFFDMNESVWIIPLSFLALLAILIIANNKFGTLGKAFQLIRDSRKEILLYLAVVLIASYIVVYDTPLPFQNFHYKSVSGPKTFGAFNAHDNYFQFVNGKAIADNEPFEKYYANRRLFFYPEDREMLPGVIYASYRKLLSGISGYVGKSYLSYTLLGIAFNVMILFPLGVLARRFFQTSNILLLSALSINAFVLVNYYLTWFKFAGAALFLSGILVLLIDYKKLLNWVVAGFFLGLATNMHAGNALGIPLFFLLFTYQNVKTSPRFSAKALAGPLLLVATFVVMNMPWSIVKQAYFRDSHALLKSFFLGGYSHRDGLLASAKLFFSTVPLSEQISVRLHHLFEMFHFRGIGELLKLFAAFEFGEFLRRWNQLEFNWIAFVYYPSLFFLSLQKIAARFFRRKSAHVTIHPIAHSRELPPMMAMAFLTMLTIIVVAYGRSPPDLNYVQPMGVILLVHTLLVGLILNSSRLVAGLYLLYVALVAGRLAVGL